MGFSKLLTGIVGVTAIFNSYAQERVTYRFIDTFSTVQSDQTATSFAPKESRQSSKSAKFKLDLDSRFPDSLKTCINVAANIWEGAINAVEPINIKVIYEDFDEDIDVITDVIYAVPDDGSYALPSSLHKQNFGNVGNMEDASISINRRKKWDCSYDSSQKNGRNATTAMLRAFGVALGFGSSVTKINNTIRFQSTNKSRFDYLIHSSSGKKLCDIKNPSELTSFVQPPKGTTIFAKDNKGVNHKLYAPQTFEWGRSLVYLDDPQSIMHYNLSVGDKRFQIDNATIDLLNSIGWNMARHGDVEIKCDGIPESGICSAYQKYDFRLINNQSGQITNAKWTYSRTLLNGSDSLICTATETNSFTIPSVDDISKYGVNINGDIPGEIVFTGIVNGKPIKDSFRIYMERKPVIKNVILKGKWINPQKPTYTVFFDVEYSGTDFIAICVEEDESVGANFFYVREPFYAHVVARNIARGYYAWIDITASNKYGYVTHTLEMPPIDLTTKPVKPSPGDDSIIIGTTDTDLRIQAYDINGNAICTVRNESELSQLKKGFYILRYYEGSQCVKQIKYIQK